MKTYIVTGYYGSGKTEFCVNFALDMRKNYDRRIYIADMDIINPYFRSREKAEFLEGYDIEIVGNNLRNNTGQDVPGVSFNFLSLIKKHEAVIIDLAGSEAGLKVLASCYSSITDYELLCVLNMFRAETCTKEKMIEFIDKVNTVSKLPVTGIINNSHLVHETKPEHILESQQMIMDVCKETNLPFSYTQLKSSIYEEIKDKILSENVLLFEKLQMRETWQ